MYKIKVQTQFSAAHFLRNYKGKCESLHGHNWRIEVLVSSEGLSSSGMVMDFSELKKMTNDVIEILDHKNLNELDYFGKHNPSSEEIANYIFLRLKEGIASYNCKLDEVRVWETDSSCASYTED